MIIGLKHVRNIHIRIEKYDGDHSTNGEKCPYMSRSRPNNGKIRTSVPDLKIAFENHVKIKEIRIFTIK